MNCSLNEDLLIQIDDVLQKNMKRDSFTKIMTTEYTLVRVEFYPHQYFTPCKKKTELFGHILLAIYFQSPYGSYYTDVTEHLISKR